MYREVTLGPYMYSEGRDAEGDIQPTSAGDFGGSEGDIEPTSASDFQVCMCTILDAHFQLSMCTPTPEHVHTFNGACESIFGNLGICCLMTDS